MPTSWTPDQIKQFQDYWDTEFVGDLAKRRRAKFVPGEAAAKVVQTKEPAHKDDFDEWLARIICYAFSVPPQWATKVMNRATADNQSAQAEDEGLEPTKEWVKDLIDEVIAEEFASPDLELAWLDEDEADPKGLEAVLEGRVKLGAVTLNEMRDALGLDPYTNAAADRAMVLTATGYVPIEANASSSPAGLTRGSMSPRGHMDCQVEADNGLPLQKYSPGQPRVPAGTPDGGQWTNGGSGEASSDVTAAADDQTGGKTGIAPTLAIPVNDSRVVTDMTPDNAGKPGAQYAAISVPQNAVTNVQNNAKTGNKKVDDTTDILLQTLARVHAAAGDGSGPWYGTRIHILFANAVRLKNLPGIGRSGVKQSFSLGDIADYGEDGTVRLDVYMRDETGKIIAIWDVKTGGAVLTGARVRELRAQAGVGNDVPVIELHLTRGATLKSRILADVVTIVASLA